MKILDLEIIFKRNKQKHYPLIISCNLHILMKWSLLTFASSFYFRGSTCFYILLKTKCSQKQPPEVFATLLKRDSNTVNFLWNFPNFCEHLFWTLSINDCSCEVWLLQRVNVATQRTKTSTWRFLAYQKIEKSPCAKNTLMNLASVSLSI